MRVQDFYFSKSPKGPLNSNWIPLCGLKPTFSHFTDLFLVFLLGIVAEGRNDLYVSDAFHKAFLEVSTPLSALSSYACFFVTMLLYYSIRRYLIRWVTLESFLRWLLRCRQQMSEQWVTTVMKGVSRSLKPQVYGVLLYTQLQLDALVV